MEDEFYYGKFEQQVCDELVRICTASGYLEGQLLRSDDIDQRWKELAPHYMADAVPQVAEYPTVAVAWAGYVGMAVATWWDKDWENCSDLLYECLHGERGFDDMDEHITRDLLGMALDGKEAESLAALLNECATAAIGFIRHENAEPQSVRAFHLFAHAVSATYSVGAAIALQRLGYRWKNTL